MKQWKIIKFLRYQNLQKYQIKIFLDTKKKVEDPFIDKILVNYTNFLQIGEEGFFNKLNETAEHAKFKLISKILIAVDSLYVSLLNKLVKVIIFSYNFSKQL